MSNIDEIIARSRQPGEFSERKSFTVSRERAIRKMREFALADPYYYVLELIQAAIASQATHVDMQIEDDSFILSYVGGGFSEDELSQIFDFLFASKADVKTGAIRQLALGINALMRFEPEQIILESGDGTMAGTTRVEINQHKNTVDVGTPEAALNGTFLRAQGIQRSKVRGQSTLSGTGYGPEETSAIESRCLAAPVPIIVNGHSVFGYTSIRTPRLPGFARVIQFDEGDLYGSIGLSRQEHNQVFKLLTWGVWIESVEYQFPESYGFGGVVTFNGLNKTADHAAIVQDQRYEELWARLSVYARMAMSDDPSAKSFEVGRLGGALLEQRELRQVIEAHALLIVVNPEEVATPAHFARAQEFGETLGAPVLTVSADDFDIFVKMVGQSASILRPRLGSGVDLALLSEAPAEAPARPWVLGVLEAPALSAQALIKELVTVNGKRKDRDKFVELLGGGLSDYRCKIFTPQHFRGEGGDVWARVLVVDRVVWEGSVDSPYPGHILDIHAPVFSPSDLLAPNPLDPSVTLAEAVAQALAHHAYDQLEDASSQALERLQKEQVRPGTSGARIALAALARDSIMRMDAGADTPQIRFDLLGAAHTNDLAEFAVFETLDGRAINLRELETIMGHSGGLVYGTVPEVPADLDGLDRSRILALDLQSEAILVEIVGHGAYIRVDSRDILARSGDGRWVVRDLATGLRAYPGAALLVENAPRVHGSARVPAIPPEAIIEELVRALRLTLVDGLGSPVRDEADEARRQAARHLRYFVCQRRLTEPELPTYGVEHLGLFWDEQFRAVSLEQIEQGFREHQTLVMLDGRAADNPQASRTPSLTRVPRALLLNPWSFQLLKPLGDLVGACEQIPNAADWAEISEEAWSDSDAMMAVKSLNLKSFKGQLGLPKARMDAPVIRVISADKRRVSLLRQSSIEFGVVGVVEFKEAVEDWDAAVRAVDIELRQQCLSLLHDVLEQISQFEKSDFYQHLLEGFFTYAGRRLRFRAPVAGPMRPILARDSDRSDLAGRILRIPLFATRNGVPVGAMPLLRQACLEHSRGEAMSPDMRIELSDALPEVLTNWMANMRARIHATPRRVEGPARPLIPKKPTEASAPRPFVVQFQELLNRLRPDALKAHVRVFDFAGASPDVSWQVRVQLDLADDRQSFIYVNGPPHLLLLNQSAPVVQRALAAEPGDGAPIAWLLLAAYAHINALLEPVTNAHELTFQRRVLDALRGGELG